jgi:flagellar biosynthesis/type III secretory pathway protein FliH
MIITLEAPENQYYTQVEDVEIRFRVLAKTVHLAANDSEDNWKLITSEEYSEYQAEKQAQQSAREKARQEEYEKMMNGDFIVEDEDNA